jgi:flagellar biosynthetic protein FliR
MQDLIESITVRKELMTAISLMVLIFGRVVFAVFFIPVFGGRQIPARIKMGTSWALVLVLYPALAGTLPSPLPLKVGLLLLLFVKEAFVGLLMGLTVSMIFYGVQAAGQFIDNQRGVSQAVIFNPALGQQASLTAQFLFQLTVVLFFTTGGHLLYVGALFRSFEILPLVTYPRFFPEWNDPSLRVLVQVSARVFFVSLQLAAPVIISMFLVEVVLGVANRVAPQMDVLFISYTVKALTALLVIFLAMDYLVPQIKILLNDTLISVNHLVDLLPAR